MAIRRLDRSTQELGCRWCYFSRILAGCSTRPPRLSSIVDMSILACNIGVQCQRVDGTGLAALRKHWAVGGTDSGRAVCMTTRTESKAEQLRDDAALVLCRMDSKGETIEAAIEAVIGRPASSAYGRKIDRYLGGK